MLRFHLPLIEPDGRISRIRLSDKDSSYTYLVGDEYAMQTGGVDPGDDPEHVLWVRLRQIARESGIKYVAR